jgi:hypothetical protein
MHRVLVGLAVAVAVLAIGAVVAVALLGNGDPGDLPQDAPLVVDAGESSEEVVDVRPSETEEPTPDVPIVQEGMTPPVEMPPIDEPGASQAAEDATADRVAAIIDSLSEGEEQALARELQQRRIRRHRDIQKYRLPSGQRLYVLQRYTGKQKLDDTQKARVAEFDEIMRPKIEAALQGMWDENADLLRQIRGFSAEGRSDEVTMLHRDLISLNKEIRDAKSTLDVEYKEMLRQVLTVEQMEFVEAGSVTRHRR